VTPSHLRSAAMGLLVALCSGCVGTGGGYGYDGGGGYGDYYALSGSDYGGWEPGYREGPYRQGFGGLYRDRGFDRGAGFGGHHGYRSAPMSHGMPFIPSHRGGDHGGGDHGGGGHSGGGHSGGGHR